MPDSPRTRPIAALLASLTSLILLVAGLLVPTAATAATTTAVTDAVFRWGVNDETGSAAYAPGTYNLLSAGIVEASSPADRVTSSNWKQSEGDVRILKRQSDDSYAAATFEGLRTDADGRTTTTSGITSGNVVEISAGTGTADPAAGTADIRWTGTFTVAYYSGMTRFWVTDPELRVEADGTGTVTATLGGYGTSMEDTEKFETLTPVDDVVIATLADVEVGADGIVTVPAYRGVEIETAGTAQTRTGDSWGSFPQSFVDFQQKTGQSSYWYSSGGSADARKPAAPITVSYAAATTEPEPGDSEVISDTATLEWGINASSQGSAPNGACGEFVAGISDGTEATYKSRDEDLVIIKRSVTGEPVEVTYDNRCVAIDGTSGEQRLRYENGHAVRDGSGTVTVQWHGAFTVSAYGGLVPWTVQDPRLTVLPDGTGKITASFTGYASSMENPDVKVPLEPVHDQTLLDLKDVSIDGDTIDATPVYAGVDYFPLTADGTRSETSAIPASVKLTNPAWGSWPQDFVDFQYRTGLSSYWHSSGGTADPNKAPLPVSISLAGEELDYVDFESVQITAQPKAVQAVVGGSATFSVAAESSRPLNYQWQIKSGLKWNDVPGATDARLVLDDVALTASPLPTYRVQVSNGLQRIVSGTATLQVQAGTAPVIGLQPIDQVSFEGGRVMFQASVSGFPTPSQQWQISRDGGSSWQDYGAPTAALWIEDAPVDLDGAQFRAIIGNGIGDPLVSEAASLTVVQTSVPALALHAGERHRFAYPVDPSVTGRVYVVGGGFTQAELPTRLVIGVVSAEKWESRGEDFSSADLISSILLQTANNITAGTFRQEFVSIPEGSLDPGTRYVAVAFSETAGDRSLDAAVPFQVQGQTTPEVSVEASATEVLAGADVTLTATAEGTPVPSLQWQSRISGGEFADLPGETGTTLVVSSITASAEYRVVASNGIGQTASAAVAVTVLPEPQTPAPTGTPPQVDDDELGAAGGITLTVHGDGTASILVGADRAGQYVGVWVHSTPQFLGWFLVDADGRITVSLAGIASGDHRVIVVDAEGAVIGWAPLQIAADGAATAPANTGSALASTGSALPAGAITTGATALLLLGIAAMLWGRRRRQQA